MSAINLFSNEQILISSSTGSEDTNNTWARYETRTLERVVMYLECHQNTLEAVHCIYHHCTWHLAPVIEDIA